MFLVGPLFLDKLTFWANRCTGEVPRTSVGVFLKAAGKGVE